MTPPKTYNELQALITNKVEESYNLEYKSADALLQVGNKGDKKDGAAELIKDVTAMANAAGGIIIYGIKEFDEKELKHLPEKITPIKRQAFSKERIEQIINGNIMPKIQGLVIHPIELKNTDEVAYVIEIPQGHTAHQNTKDQRYYKRQNFEATAMLDFEIRDVMHRNSFPQLTLEFEFKHEIDHNRDVNMGRQFGTPTEYYLAIRIKNNGNVYASYVNYFVEINRFFLDENTFGKYPTTRKDVLNDEYLEYYGENTIRDVVDSEYTAVGFKPKYGPSRFDPILPKMRSREEKLKIGNGQRIAEQLKVFSDTLISWRIYADNAPEQTGHIRIGDIPSFKQYAE